MWRNAREPDRRSSAAGDRAAALYWSVLGFVAIVEIVPLFVVKYLPLVDLPNHEARIAILAHYGSNPTMQKFYVVDWRPIPDLAFDLFSVPLVRIGLTPSRPAACFSGFPPSSTSRGATCWRRPPRAGGRGSA